MDELVFISWESRKEDMMNIASCSGSYDIDAIADEYYSWLKSVHGKYASFDFEPMPEEDEEYIKIILKVYLKRMKNNEW